MRLPGDTRPINGNQPNRFIRKPQSPFIALAPDAAPGEKALVWDPIMSRWVPEDEVYVAETPPGPKQICPWEKDAIANQYKHMLGIPAYKEPTTSSASPTSTTQTDSTTLGGIVKVKWVNVKAATGKDIYIDWTKGSHQFCILTANKTIHLTNPYSGLFCLSVWQDGNGGWTLTWDINHYTGGVLDATKPVVYWPGGTVPVMTAAASAHDMYSFAWLPFAAAGAGAYEGMCTQDMRVPTAP
jgi:hypothetical protein